jgi:uroporphyrinogen-III synthase
MTDGPRAIWVTRPADGARRTTIALTKAGYVVIVAPVLEVGTTLPEPMPVGPWPDWLIFVSATAVEGFLKARGLPAFPEPSGRVPPTRIAVVGQRTAEASLAAGFAVDLTPSTQNARGLVAAFGAADLTGARIWIPGGNRRGSALEELPEELSRAGAQVSTFQVYDTRARPLVDDELARLDAATPGAMLFYSPSAAEAVFQEQQPAAVVRWRDTASCVAIGETTRRRLAQLGARQVFISREPSDAGVLATLMDSGLAATRRP